MRRASPTALSWGPRTINTVQWYLDMMEVWDYTLQLFLCVASPTHSTENIRDQSGVYIVGIVGPTAWVGMAKMKLVSESGAEAEAEAEADAALHVSSDTGQLQVRCKLDLGSGPNACSLAFRLPAKISLLPGSTC